MMLVHECTVEFMRLVKRNNLRKCEGQQAAIYLEGLIKATNS